MENLTHSLLGAVFAELTLPPDATSSTRRLFFTAGIVASNLPDADLLYTQITPPPLGYLLHHRGHTHTLVGLVAEALLIGAICLFPAVRGRIGDARNRFATLIAVSLLSHVVLDSWNSYGVHPFYPFDNRWYYGDAIYIAEPWFWVFLGVTALLNAQNPYGKLILGALFGVLMMAATIVGLVPWGALVVPVVVAATMALAMRGVSPHRRSAIALMLMMVFVAGMFGAREAARATVFSSPPPGATGDIVDVVLSPAPANPLCWSALVIARDGSDYVMTRGSAALVQGGACGVGGDGAVRWNEGVRQSVGRLRELASTDCRVRAWLQFGRAPMFDQREISDLRFGGAARGNFTSMRLASPRARACPANLTNWGMPRADLLLSS